MAESSVRIGIYAADKASPTIKSVQGTLGKLSADAKSSILTGVGLGAGVTAFNLMANAVTGVVHAMGDMVQAAIDDEQSVARLNAALEANIPSWDGNTDAIERTIEASERLGFTDDETRASLSFLTAATHDVTRAQELHATAMDLARFKGISLQQASEALVRVEGGRFRLLASLGIKLKENATATDALAAVQAVAAGQAQEFGDTTAGAMLGAQIAMEEAGEEMGRVLAPAIRDIAEFVRDDLAPALEELGHLFEAQPDQINPITEAIYHLTGGLSGMSAQMQIDQQQSEQFLDALGGIPPVVDDATGAVERHGFSYEDMAERLKDGMSAAKTEAKLGFDALVDELVGAQTSWEKGWDDYLDIMENDLTKAAEIAKIQGLLTGEELAEGLRSSDPERQAAANEVKRQLEERLFALQHNVNTIGYATGVGYAAALSATKAQIAAAAHVLRENASAPLTGAQAQSYTWGRNLGINWANGMVSATAYARYAAESLASQAAGRLAPWHSPPQFGPLKDLDTDAQELGQLWAENLGKGIGQNWMPNVDLGVSGGAADAMPMGSGSGGSLPPAIIIQLDGKELVQSTARWSYLMAPAGPSRLPR